MQTFEDTECLGLRERKRRATKQAIEKAAISLAYENGYEAATVEAICGAADVSLRTFFNYFPSKDAAILGEQFSPLSVERARELLDEHAPDLLAGIAAAWIETAPPNPSASLLQQRREVAHENPQAMHQRMLAKRELKTSITAAVIAFLQEYPGLRRLEPSVAEAEEAAIMVSLIETAAHHAVDVWIQGGSDTPLNSSLIIDTLGEMAGVLGKG